MRNYKNLKLFLSLTAEICMKISPLGSNGPQVCVIRLTVMSWTTTDELNVEYPLQKVGARQPLLRIFWDGVVGSRGSSMIVI